ncbi:MAG TPA: DUF5685 family protein [Clostridia bacterium]|nr:DUF5685 family protein [Clostridia bacterium]
MFGYVTANRQALSPEQEARYRAAYCGLCDALKARHGAPARLALNYDFAFLTLLLDSLYEPERRAIDARCAMHPLRCRKHEASAFTDYAADMTVALFYHKCLDDWRDEHRPVSLAAASLFRRRFDALAPAYPRQCAAVAAGLSRLQELERAGDAPADEAAAAFGGITAAVFAPREDRWAESLGALGMALGKFIYMMDAWEDCKKDIRRGNYNPFAADYGAPDFDERCRAILLVLMRDCAAALEKLPLVEDIALLRNVIYSGIWTRFEWKRARERRRPDADHRPV